MIKSVIALIMVLLTSFSSLQSCIIDVKSESNKTTSTDYEIEGMNSFGKILASAFDESKESIDSEEYTEATILGTYVENDIAKVSYDSTVDGTVIVGIFDESTEKLYDSFSSDFDSDKKYIC